MRKPILGKAAFSVAVALMLAFGARQAVAAPGAARAVLGCSSNEECQEYCEVRYPGQEVTGWCDSPPFGHCHCDLP